MCVPSWLFSSVSIYQVSCRAVLPSLLCKFVQLAMALRGGIQCEMGLPLLNNNKENFTDMPIFCPSPAGRERWGGDAKRAQSSIASPSKCSVHSQCHVLPQKHLIHPLHTHNFKYYIYINWNRIRSVFRLSLSGCYIHIFLYSQLQNYWHPW